MSTQQGRGSSGMQLGGGERGDQDKSLNRRGLPRAMVENSSDLEQHQQYANFRNDSTFPPFACLPEESSISLEFYATSDGFNYMPEKHWCFLAEVIDVESFLRLRLIVRDKSGTTLPIAFHTEGRGAEFASEVQPGQTVAVLYALQHGFLDFTTGIRLEDSGAIKILPVSLTELLRLNDQVHQYSTEVDRKRTCHGCNERKISLQKCGRCSLFWYCGKVSLQTCQTNGWIERGHKQDCKILKDKDLQAMLLLEWSDFIDFVKFPMQSGQLCERENGTS